MGLNDLETSEAGSVSQARDSSVTAPTEEGDSAYAVPFDEYSIPSMASFERPATEPRQPRDEDVSSPLIPGLPCDVARRCLAFVPRRRHLSLRAVCHAWARELVSPEYYALRRELGQQEQWLVLLAGGRGGRRPLRLEAFDPTVVPQPSLPSIFSLHPSRTHFLWGSAVVSVGTAVFLLGGATGNESYLTQGNAWRFDGISGCWKAASSMLEARSNFASGVVGSRYIVVAGGWGATRQPLNSAEVYDSFQDRWYPLLPMQRRRGSCMGVMFDGRFMVISGIDKLVNESTITTVTLMCAEYLRVSEQQLAHLIELHTLRSDFRNRTDASECELSERGALHEEGSDGVESKLEAGMEDSCQVLSNCGEVELMTSSKCLPDQGPRVEAEIVVSDAPKDADQDETVVATCLESLVLRGDSAPGISVPSKGLPDSCQEVGTDVSDHQLEYRHIVNESTPDAVQAATQPAEGAIRTESSEHEAVERIGVDPPESGGFGIVSAEILEETREGEDPCSPTCRDLPGPSGRDSCVGDGGLLRWHKIEKMWCQISLPGSLAVARGKIFGVADIGSAIREYIESENVWAEVCKVPYPQKGFHLVSLNDGLLLLGVYGGHWLLPQENIVLHSSSLNGQGSRSSIYGKAGALSVPRRHPVHWDSLGALHSEVLGWSKLAL